MQLSLMAPKVRFFSDPARMAAKQKEEEEKQKKEQEAKKVPEAKKVKELSASATAVKELDQSTIFGPVIKVQNEAKGQKSSKGKKGGFR